MEARKVYQVLASSIQARRNSIENDNSEWVFKHGEMIRQIVKDLLPSGAGIDSGTKIDLDASHGERLILTCGYHHMNDGGFYDGWTEHKIIVTPSFSGLNIRITGRDRNQIKDHLYETFDYSLTRPIVWNEKDSRWMDTRYLKSNIPEVQS
jgi:hypothetical protein